MDDTVVEERIFLPGYSGLDAEVKRADKIVERAIAYDLSGVVHRSTETLHEKFGGANGFVFQS